MLFAHHLEHSLRTATHLQNAWTCLNLAGSLAYQLPSSRAQAVAAGQLLGWGSGHSLHTGAHLQQPECVLQDHPCCSYHKRRHLPVWAECAGVRLLAAA